jgi:hypothetical protein
MEPGWSSSTEVTTYWITWCWEDPFMEFYHVALKSVNYKVKEDEMGGTCGTNGGEEECV